MAIKGFNRPDKGDVKAIYDYLCQLSDWLQYMFTNIDEANLTQTFADTLSGMGAAEAASAAAIRETANAIALVNKNIREMQEQMETVETNIVSMLESLAAIITSIENIDARVDALETGV